MTKIGFGIPTSDFKGNLTDIPKIAKRIEELGYDSVWVFDRVFWASNPREEYPGTPGQPWPDAFKTSADPLTVLSMAAAATEKIRLGTSILVIGYYNPVMLARRVATMDVFSGGRMTLGLGSGWSTDEHEAAGANARTRGKRADEFLDVFKGAMMEGKFAHDGEFFSVPENIMIDSVQKPHVPILLAAYSPATLQRAALKANGWTPAGLPISAMKEMHEGAKAIIAGAGGNPDDFKMHVRANLMAITPEPLAERFPFNGSLGQIVEDFNAAAEIGADEVFFDPMGGTTDKYFEMMETIKNAIG